MHLPDEALCGVQRHSAFPVGTLDPAHHVEGIEQTEVQRTGQQRVREPRVAGQHGVLVRTERRQPVGQKVLQRQQCLPARRRKPARAVHTDEGDVAVPLPPVEVAADLVVDLVLLGPPRLRHPDADRYERTLPDVPTGCGGRPMNGSRFTPGK